MTIHRVTDRLWQVAFRGRVAVCGLRWRRSALVELKPPSRSSWFVDMRGEEDVRRVRSMNVGETITLGGAV